MAQGLRPIDPLVFDDNIADNWRKFEKEWRIYCFAGLSDKSKKVQAYTLLNLAGSKAIDIAETLVYADEEDHEDPEDSIAMGLIQLGSDVHMLHPEAPEMPIERGDERRRGSSVASLDTDSDPVLKIPESDTEYYSLTQRPLGYCLIINNYNFEERTPHLNRKGTEKDKDALSRLFKKMHFIVKVLDDLMASDIKEAMKNFAKKDHTRMGAFVCCVLSHGEKGAVLGVDAKPVEIHELTLPFAECRTLTSKPKLFFIQACQGREAQNGVWTADGQVNDTEEGTFEEDDYNPALRKVPIKADFLIGMATVEHYQSFRHTREGSIYIQELCRQLKSSCPRNEDILSILTKVNRAVSTRVLKGHKQMPEPRYTLTKKLVLPMD